LLDIFLHHSALQDSGYRKLEAGANGAFVITDGQQGKQAFEVTTQHGDTHLVYSYRAFFITFLRTFTKIFTYFQLIAPILNWYLHINLRGK